MLLSVFICVYLWIYKLTITWLLILAANVIPAMWWKRDQVSETTLGHGVLAREKTIVRAQSDFGPALHCMREDCSTQLSCQHSWYRRFEEYPDKPTVSGT